MIGGGGIEEVRDEEVDDEDNDGADVGSDNGIGSKRCIITESTATAAGASWRPCFLFFFFVVTEVDGKVEVAGMA